MPRQNLLIIILASILSLACYHRASRNRYVATVAEAMNLIRDGYVDPVREQALFEGAMRGMTKQLDPNSGYDSPSEYTDMRQDLDQEFGGIGVVVEYNELANRLQLSAPMPDGPAAKAQLKAGDIVLKIDGEDTLGLGLAATHKKIRGKQGTKLKLTVQHLDPQQPPEEVELQREIIRKDSVLGDTRDPQQKYAQIFRLQEHPSIGYIRITTFGERTSDEVLAILRSYQTSTPPLTGVVIDLRENSGGLLKEAIDTCDLFLDKGVIVSTKGRGGKTLDAYEATTGVELNAKIPLAILIDKRSASASEIVAACLQDHGRATIFGQRSYGKGTVQNVLRLEGGKGALRLTIARYYRPSEKNIHKLENAKDTDDWGVIPSPGMNLDLTNEELQRFRMVRMQRDILALGGVPAPLKRKAGTGTTETPVVPASSPAPTKEEGVAEPTDTEPTDEAPEAELGEAEKGYQLTPADEAAARLGGLFADPQLAKVVSWLLEKQPPKVP